MSYIQPSKIKFSAFVLPSLPSISNIKVIHFSAIYKTCQNIHQIFEIDLESCFNLILTPCNTYSFEKVEIS